MPTLSPREAIIERLNEARRYVGTETDLVRREIAEVIDDLGIIGEPRADRLQQNLKIAAKYIQVEPDVCRSYMSATAFELQCIKEMK